MLRGNRKNWYGLHDHDFRKDKTCYSTAYPTHYANMAPGRSATPMANFTY